MVRQHQVTGIMGCMDPFPPLGCRLHGQHCSVPWGYDPDHTDSARPYTVDELADRLEAPHRYAYGPYRDYEVAFHVWRSMRRDSRLNAEEEDVHVLGRIENAGLMDVLRDHPEIAEALGVA